MLMLIRTKPSHNMCWASAQYVLSLRTMIRSCINVLMIQSSYNKASLSKKIFCHLRMIYSPYK